MLEHNVADSDPLSAQLHADLSFSITESLREPQPVLHHLNADSSWLLQIPRPASARRFGGRVYYNILVDPWLDGPQRDPGSWVGQQWHATPSKVKTIEELEELVRRVESFARRAKDMKDVLDGPAPEETRRRISWRSRASYAGEDDDDLWDGQPVIDMVAVSHEFTDHCNKETLLQLDPEVPVFAATNASHLIQSWNHFHFVTEIPRLRGPAPDYRIGNLPSLPEWLAICRIEPESDPYHAAVLFAFSLPRSRSQSASSRTDAISARILTPPTAESNTDDEPVTPFILYTPHGICSGDVEMLTSAAPPLKALCFLHGLHDVFFRPSTQLNLGAHNALAVQRILKARYWMPTHDGAKKGGVLAAWLLRRRAITLEDALKCEANQDATSEDDDGSSLTGFENIGNGESKILEW